MTKFLRAYVPDDQIQNAVRDIGLMFIKDPGAILQQLGLPPGPEAPAVPHFTQKTTATTGQLELIPA